MNKHYPNIFSAQDDRIGEIEVSVPAVTSNTGNLAQALANLLSPVVVSKAFANFSISESVVRLDQDCAK